MKRPRDWAAEIAALPTREQRRAALLRVPTHWQAMVRTHVQNFWTLKQQGGRGD